MFKVLGEYMVSLSIGDDDWIQVMNTSVRTAG